MILLIIVLCIIHLGIYLMNLLPLQKAEKYGQSEGVGGKKK